LIAVGLVLNGHAHFSFPLYCTRPSCADRARNVRGGAKKPSKGSPQ
jgi:hypothetical protein